MYSLWHSDLYAGPDIPPSNVVMTVDGKSFEKLALAEEESLHCRKQQTLAETSRTTKEIILTLADKFVNVFRLVDI